MSHEECCPQLPKPVIAKSESRLYTRINPMDVLNGQTVFWAYNGLSQAQTIRFFLRGARLEPDPQMFEPTAIADGCAQVLLPALAFAPRVGKSLEIWADVTRDGCTERSYGLHLSVSRFKPRDLPRPQVTELTCEDCEHWLNLGQLPADATMSLERWPLMAKGQKVWVRCIGKLADNESTFIYLLKGHKVTDEQVAEGLREIIPRWWLDRLMDRSTMKLEVRVAFDGSNAQRCAQRFPSAKVGVRSAPIVLPALGIDEAQAGTLNPHHVTEGATARICWAGLRTSDWVCVHLGSGQALECKASTSPGSLTFDVSPNYIRGFFGKTIDMWYTLVRDGRLFTSPITALRVLDLSEFPALTVDRASAGVLDLNAFSDEPELRVARWEFAVQGDKTWTKISGTGEDGNPHEVIMRNAVPLQEHEVSLGIVDGLLRDMLQTFANDSAVKLQMWASFDGNDLITAKEFPALTLQLITQRFTDVEEFTGLGDELVTAGGRITSVATMDIELLSGAAQAGIANYSAIAGMREGASICLCKDQTVLTPPQRLRLTFKRGYLQVRFAWTWLHGNATVYFYDSQGNQLGVIALSGLSVGGQLHQWVDFLAPNGTRIHSLEAEVGDYSFIDKVQMIR